MEIILPYENYYNARRKFEAFVASINLGQIVLSYGIFYNGTNSVSLDIYNDLSPQTKDSIRVSFRRCFESFFIY